MIPTHVTPSRPVVSALVVAFGVVVGYHYAVQVHATSSFAGVAVPRTTPKTAGAEEVLAARAMLDRYCVTCHNQRVKTAGLALDTLSVEEATDAASLEKVVRKLRTGTMPPAGRPRPAQETYGTVAASLEAVLDRAAASAPNPG